MNMGNSTKLYRKALPEEGVCASCETIQRQCTVTFPPNSKNAASVIPLMNYN